MVQIIRPHSSIYILIKKKKKKNDSVHCSIKEALESFFFHFSHFNGIVHVLCLHVLSFSHRKTFRKVLKTSCFAIVWSVQTHFIGGHNLFQTKRTSLLNIGEKNTISQNSNSGKITTLKKSPDSWKY